MKCTVTVESNFSEPVTIDFDVKFCISIENPTGNGETFVVNRDTGEMLLLDTEEAAKQVAAQIEELTGRTCYVVDIAV
jgi:glucose dehydrogenase